MDAYSSGEELIIKARKPYTITKQRERWTEEEHNRFLEALKLHGRAWQRIEEHIGTKTAVQIRSHAQKFFSKLEKEALAKGVPVGQAIDIEIPPPRPKRKPSNPYPRKTGAANSPSTQIRVKEGKEVPSNSVQTTKQVLDLEKEPLPEKSVGDEEKQNAEGIPVDDKPSGALWLFHEAPPSSLGVSINENSAITTERPKKSCNLNGYVPMNKQPDNIERHDIHDMDGSNRSQKIDEPRTDQNGTENAMKASKNFPRHAPVQILDKSLGACSQALSSDVSYQESAFPQMGIPGHAALFSNPGVSSAAVESQNSTSRSTNSMIPSFYPPFGPLPNMQEDYSSAVQMSSTFSSLIVSALVQNPAAHAAASFAASFWPCTNMESSANSPTILNGGFARPINPAPSMAAIAAATVAAATAWWAAHGMLPLCAPPHPGFECPPASSTGPLTNLAQSQPANEEKEENNFQAPTAHAQEPAAHPHHSASKSSETSSSSASGNSSGLKKDTEVAANDNTEIKPAQVNEQKESSKGMGKKQVDRSSCGSNTPSGSDLETDALEKNEKEKEGPMEPDADQLSGEGSTRRCRVPSNVNDARKEVSEEGRLAFQALFSRHVLPQSFSPRHDVTNMDKDMNDGVFQIRQNVEETNDHATKLDLNRNTWESCSNDQGREINRVGEDDEKDGLLSLSLGEGKFKARITGFKPYKRCSVEARDSRGIHSSQDQEHCSKRIRLEGEASM